MPKHLIARPPLDATEERHVRKLTHSMHAPTDWIVHATIVAYSWTACVPTRSLRRCAAIPRRCANGCTPLMSAASTGWA